MTITDSFLIAARSAGDLLADPAVADAWDRPSALAELSVGGLAAHLAAQVIMVQSGLSSPEPAVERVSLLGHYERVRWIGADLDHEVNVAIRTGSERAGADGPDAVHAAVAAALAELPGLLAAAGPDRPVQPPAGPWALSLDAFLTTRMLEITVHSDDLACSVDRPTPELPAEVLTPVLSLLASLAVRRHGQAAVIRGLARSERAPASISAF